MRRTVAVAAVVLAGVLEAAPAAAQAPRRQCQCATPPTVPGGVPIVVGTPPDGRGGGGGGADGLIGLLPLGPLGALLAGRGAPTPAAPVLAAGDSIVRIEPFPAAETRATLAFRANLDSLSAGMRAPDTATPAPGVLLLAGSLLLAGGLLLRGPSA